MFLNMIHNHNLFSLGKLYVTQAVNNLICDNLEFAKLVCNSLKRHLAGDWGDMSETDKRLNNLAIEEGSRIFSAYIHGNVKIWIITEAQDEEGNRACTTVLFPHEY